LLKHAQVIGKRSDAEVRLVAADELGIFEGSASQ
jgi:hypothetical protein